MSNNLLEDELQKLQVEYRIILEHASKKIFQKESNAIIDEINIFWQRNKKLVQCILRYLYKPNSAYVFTAATYMDIDDYEHYPFVSLGKYHFWDDTIYRYIQVVKKDSNNSFDKKMREQVMLTINDNIKILDRTMNCIYILPIHLLSDTDAHLIHMAAEQAFLSLFNKNISIDYYRKNFITISDINNGLSTNIAKSIIFSENDDYTLDFETRFKNYKESTALPLPKGASDGEVFWFCIYSYLAQAFDIILMCTQYQLIPYIRFEVAIKYIIRLSSVFGDNKELTDMIFRCVIAYILHHTFDKEKIYNISFKEYYQIIQQFNFEEKLFSELKQENITLNNLSISRVKSIIGKNFNSVLT